MNELSLLKSMWAPKVRRKTELIVPCITCDGMTGSLNNDSWTFNVPYAFRDALDIAYEERKKEKESFMVWTQGPMLSFREGDVIHSRDGRSTLNVSLARPMAWDSAKHEMDQGSVIYSEFAVSANGYSKLRDRSCSQMQFLQLLVQGQHDG